LPAETLIPDQLKWSRHLMLVIRLWTVRWEQKVGLVASSQAPAVKGAIMAKWPQVDRSDLQMQVSQQMLV